METNYETLIDKANEVMNHAKQRLNTFGISSVLSDGNNIPLDIADRLVYKRFVTKYEIPDDSYAEKRAAQCAARFEATELRIEKHSHALTDIIKKNRKVLRDARGYLYRLLIEHPLSKPHMARHGPGVSDFKNETGTSELAKYCDARWTCTKGALPYFIKCLYSNRWVRRHCWIRFDRLYKPIKGRKQRFPYHGETPYEYFYKHIRLLVHIVPGNVFFTVPKNNDKDRPACKEPLGNMYVQLLVGHQIKQQMKAAGNCLFTGQERHQRLIRDSNLATIDFSDASDSILLEWVRLLFPPEYVEILTNVRSPYVLHNNVWKRLNKCSSMGNGFTFEVMSALLWSIGKALGSKRISVFGDDVIIENELAHRFISICVDLGFVVNQEKSFINLSFRESCGSFYHDELGYLVSYDFKYIRTVVDIKTTINKLYMIEQANQVNSELSLWVKETRQALISLVPEDWCGNPPPKGPTQSEMMADYVWVEGLSNNRVNSLLQWIADRYQYDIAELRWIKTHRLDAKVLEKGRRHRFMAEGLRLKGSQEPELVLRGVTSVTESVLVKGPGNFVMSKRDALTLRATEVDYLRGIFEVERLTPEMWSAYLV